MCIGLSVELRGELYRLLAAGETHAAQQMLRRQLDCAWWDVLPKLQALARELLSGQPPPAPLLELAAAIELRREPYGPTPVELLDMAQNYTVEERVAAFALANALYGNALLYSEKVHDGLRTTSEFIKLLRQESPGYSSATYHTAYDRAMLDTK